MLAALTGNQSNAGEGGGSGSRNVSEHRNTLDNSYSKDTNTVSNWTPGAGAILPTVSDWQETGTHWHCIDIVQHTSQHEILLTM